MNNQSTKISVYTLVDITATGVAAKSSDQLERDQHRNWQTVFQIISLRTQPTIQAYPTAPKTVSLDSPHQFGQHYKGYHRCWKFIFTVEPMNLFGDAAEPDRVLKQDFDNIPIIPGLTESVALIDPVFYTDGILKNIYFKVSTNLE